MAATEREARADEREHIADEREVEEDQRLRQRAASLDDARARRVVADSKVRTQIRRAARLRRELASAALAIAHVEDEVAVNLDALAALDSPERAQSRSDSAQRAREFAEEERGLANRYTHV